MSASYRDELDLLTYAVQYNPNCPQPFLVRLVGPGNGHIDYKPHNETGDILGFGQTLEQAARQAIRSLEIRRRQLRHEKSPT